MSKEKHENVSPLFFLQSQTGVRFDYFTMMKSPQIKFCGLSLSAPVAQVSKRVIVPNPPDSGKDTAEIKDVHCKVESEGKNKLNPVRRVEIPKEVG